MAADSRSFGSTRACPRIVRIVTRTYYLEARR